MKMQSIVLFVLLLLLPLSAFVENVNFGLAENNSLDWYYATITVDNSNQFYVAGNKSDFYTIINLRVEYNPPVNSKPGWHRSFQFGKVSDITFGLNGGSGRLAYFRIVF